MAKAKTKEVTRELVYVFDEKEITAKGRRLAELNNLIINKKNEIAAERAQRKAELENLYQDFNEESYKINEGKEYRNVLCEYKWHTPVEGKKEVTRTDIGETWVEDMTATEINLFNQPDAEEENTEQTPEAEQTGEAERQIESPFEQGAEEE